MGLGRCFKGRTWSPFMNWTRKELEFTKVFKVKQKKQGCKPKTPPKQTLPLASIPSWHIIPISSGEEVFGGIRKGRWTKQSCLLSALFIYTAMQPCFPHLSIETVELKQHTKNKVPHSVFFFVAILHFNSLSC